MRKGSSPSSLPPSPLAGECRGEGACSHAVIPNVSNTVIPDVSHPVIPDVSNRESKAKVRGLDSRRVQQPPPAPPAQNAAVILLPTESQILRFAQNDRGGWANARGKVNIHHIIPGFPRRGKNFEQPLGEGACSHAVIPDVSNAVIPDVSHTVIPDVLNRESKAGVRGLAPGGSNDHRPLKMDMTGVRAGITGRTG